MTQPPSILVVDDDPRLLAATVRLLQEAGYDVWQSDTGLGGLELARARRPDLLLLDVDLPDLNGIEVCQRIKGDPKSAHQFVILLSGTRTSSDKQSQGLECGADGYIVRPIANRELLARIWAFVRLQQTEAALRKSEEQLRAALREKDQLIEELQSALDDVKQLSGLLPICASCKKIRDGEGYWNQVEAYIATRSGATFTHGICPDCVQKYFPQAGHESEHPPPVAGGRETPMIPSSRYDEYLEALLRGERSTCADIVRHLLAAEVPVRTLYTGLFQPALYRVGELWETNQVSVATEHLATAITEGLLHLVYPSLFSGPRVGKSAVISCAPNEYHQLGGKMVADCFELLGWRGYFLGANTPVQDLIAFVQARQPDAIALSLAVYFNLPALLEAATAIRSEFPRLPVVVGGQAFRAGGRGRVEEVPGVCHLASLDELESWIQSTFSHGV